MKEWRRVANAVVSEIKKVIESLKRVIRCNPGREKGYTAGQVLKRWCRPPRKR